MPQLLIARQPIFNETLDVVGYELLYRAHTPPLSPSDPAALKAALDKFTEVGLENLVGEKKVYLNASRGFLTGKYPIALPPASLVLQVQDDIAQDQESLDTVAALSQQGYQIALEKVISVNKVAKLLNQVNIVKIDLANLDRLQLAETVKRLKLHRVKLLANQVETPDDLAYCQRLGFGYFEGYFLCRPRVVAGRRLDASRTVVMRSLAQIQDSNADFQNLAKIISQDVSLSYKLLKLVNSAYYSLSKTITSLEQAVALIGLNQLRAWMTLILMASVRNKPHELTTLALARAKMCELLAKDRGERQTDPFFLVGLFSILDALMDLPMQDLIGNLPLSEDIATALVSQKGQPGEVLKIALAYERGQWDGLLALKGGPKLADISAAYLEAIQWTTSVVRTMNNA